MKLAVAPALLGKGATSNFSNVTKMSEMFPRAVAANFLFFSPPMAGFLFNNCNLRDRGRMQFCILPRKSPLLSKKLKRSLTFYQLLNVSAAERAPFLVSLRLLIVLDDIFKMAGTYLLFVHQNHNIETFQRYTSTTVPTDKVDIKGMKRADCRK